MKGQAWTNMERWDLVCHIIPDRAQTSPSSLSRTLTGNLDRFHMSHLRSCSGGKLFCIIKCQGPLSINVPVGNSEREKKKKDRIYLNARLEPCIQALHQILTFIRLHTASLCESRSSLLGNGGRCKHVSYSKCEQVMHIVWHHICMDYLCQLGQRQQQAHPDSHGGGWVRTQYCWHDYFVCYCWSNYGDRLAKWRPAFLDEQGQENEAVEPRVHFIYSWTETVSSM